MEERKEGREKRKDGRKEMMEERMLSAEMERFSEGGFLPAAAAMSAGDNRVWLNTGTKAPALPVWSKDSQWCSVEQSQVRGFTPFAGGKSSSAATPRENLTRVAVSFQHRNLLMQTAPWAGRHLPTLTSLHLQLRAI